MCVGLSRFVSTAVYITANSGRFATGLAAERENPLCFPLVIAVKTRTPQLSLVQNRSYLSVCDSADCLLLRLLNARPVSVVETSATVAICDDADVNLVAVSPCSSTRTTMDAPCRKTIRSTSVALHSKPLPIAPQPEVDTANFLLDDPLVRDGAARHVTGQVLQHQQTAAIPFRWSLDEDHPVYHRQFHNDCRDLGFDVGRLVCKMGSTQSGHCWTGSQYNGLGAEQRCCSRQCR